MQVSSFAGWRSKTATPGTTGRQSGKRAWTARWRRPRPAPALSSNPVRRFSPLSISGRKMPTFETSDEFRRQYQDLTPSQRAAFKLAVAKLVADLRSGAIRPGLRVKRYHRREGVW